MTADLTQTDRIRTEASCTVSIIVPTFNSGETIMRCLDSIRKQTFTDYEILIQDGNSIDGTLDLVRAFSESSPSVNIRYVQEADSGVYDAMNKAMQRSNGEWLFFLGSDDALHDPEVLARMMLDPRTADSELVYGNVEFVGDSFGNISGTIYDDHFSLQKLMTKNICHQAIFYKSSLTKKVGYYNTRYPACADWDFNMRCWAQTEFVFLDVVVSYFYSGGTSSSRLDDKFWSDFGANVRRHGLLNGMSFFAKVLFVLKSQSYRVMYYVFFKVKEILAEQSKLARAKPRRKKLRTIV